jgi:transcriptional regulator with XRE-family HTH domain
VRAELKKLGEDLSIARKRRRMIQQRVADGAGLDVATVRRLEQGHPSVSLGSLGMVLLALGERGRLADLLDVGVDDLGIALPKRVRTPKRTPQREPNGVIDHHDDTNPDDGAF